MYGVRLLPLVQMHPWVSPYEFGLFLQHLLIVGIGNLCGTSKQPQASAQGALAAWTAAKFPASQVRTFSDANASLMTGLLHCSSSLVWLSMDMSRRAPRRS